ncbi:wax ester/triacylglycerol synthase family O-acyltransferase [Dietzia aerolata]|uniref:Wax ester/triacylglycerol synthase family O-acyltransferase n=1 Tax=Dietzia aerolata TaxID=595984 RepID=A0ABV5JWG5_9ACTN|nr:wax ester/triacylglycerol synthase family O-acyltransferase [Dietzia aerolata]
MSQTPSITYGPPDHTYLHLDTPSRPMHWAMLLEVDPEPAGPLDLEAVRHRVAERASRYDLFRTGIEGGRWTRPRMIQLAEISPERQVSAAEFTGESGLRGTVGTLMAEHLRRGLPFWHITLLSPADPTDPNPDPGHNQDPAPARQYLLLRVHHSLSDGIAGAAFSALLADGDDEELAEFDRFATSPRFSISGIDPADLKTAKTAFEEAWAAGQPGRHWPTLTGQGRREVAWHSVSTRDLRRAAKRASATPHEFVLAAVGAAASTVPPTGETSENIRVTLPVTLDKEFRHTGNAVAVSLLNLSGAQGSVAGQLPRIREQLARIEDDSMALNLAAADDAPRAPWPIFRLLSGASMKKMSPDIHVGINPGFTRVRTVLGAPMLGLTALSPLVGYSFSVTVLILGTRTSFGIVYDSEALPGYGATFVEAFNEFLQADAEPEDTATASPATAATDSRHTASTANLTH